MKEPDWKNCEEEDLWQWVAVNLQRAGIPTVLVGGAAAAVHSRGAYHSGDLDLLLDAFPLPKIELLQKAMEGIGFTEAKGRYFRHPECDHLYVEFVPGPLHLGEDYDVRPQVRILEGVKVRIISPTDRSKTGSHPMSISRPVSAWIRRPWLPLRTG
jgi:hypothetical protein